MSVLCNITRVLAKRWSLTAIFSCEMLEVSFDAKSSSSLQVHRLLKRHISGLTTPMLQANLNLIQQVGNQ